MHKKRYKYALVEKVLILKRRLVEHITASDLCEENTRIQITSARRKPFSSCLYFLWQAVHCRLSFNFSPHSHIQPICFAGFPAISA